MLILTGCTKSDFFLEFKLGKEVTENYNVTYYASDSKGGITVQAVASVRDGQCELRGITKNPTLVYITSRKSLYPLVLIAEKGKHIEIQGEKGDPLEWEVMENKINEQLTEWRKENIKSLQSKAVDSVNNAVKIYVEENANNPVAFILLQCYYTQSENEREYVDLLGSLKEDAKNEEWIKLIGRADYLYDYPSYPARLESMILRSTKESADTLMIDDKNPVFLLFWQGGSFGGSKQAITDSIKKLVKEIPDSSRLVADICMDLDSAAWRNSIRRDSLDKVKRFWVPMGMADPTMKKLKVNSIPYYIVFDKKGNQIYRGTELEEAMKEYRKMVKKSR